MKSRLNVTVDVKVNLATCLAVLAWFVLNLML